MTACRFCESQNTDEIGCRDCGAYSEGVVLPDSNSPGEASADMVNAPAHYTAHPSGIECIDITEHMNFIMGKS